jgi:hypothetical protein
MWIQIARREAITSNRCYRSANHTFGSVSNVALERRHVNLIATTNGVVYPKPSADALAIWTSREIRNIEGLECSCGAILDYRHNNKIIGFYVINIGLVGNSQRTASNI